MIKTVLLLAAVFVLASNGNVTAEDRYGRVPDNLKQYLDRLVTVYPDKVKGYDDKFLILQSGAKFHISDGRSNKTFQELLEAPDIDDMFYVPYPIGTAPSQPKKDIDPGRVRFEPLFVALYGDCEKGDVVNDLTDVKWLPKHGGGTVKVTALNGVAKALTAISNELDELPEELIKFLKPSGGTYNCRNIAGSKARSMHGYGAAIDINTHYSNYWWWSKGEPRWQNRIPIRIVRIFEKHGFIWGGYWYHYDTMHFEYRPELLLN
jgi:D-alanyl-D-alanine carboxypeptidase